MSTLASHSGMAQTFSWSTTTNFDITNGTPLVLTSTVSRAGIMNSANGKSPIVNIGIDHPFCADIDITLTSPAGTTIILTSDNGGSGDNYTNTYFSNSATTQITSGSAPFTGGYLPEESFSAFDGELADGVWTLTIEDDASGDDGILVSGSFLIGSNNFFSYELTDGSIAHTGSYQNDLILPGTGVTWGNNIHNQANSALEFNGTSNATASTQAKPTTGVTLAAWIKPSNITPDQKIIGIADEANVTDLVSLGIKDGTADFEVREENGNGRVSMGAIITDKWVHIAGTWSSDDNMLRLYVNGELVGTTTGPGAPLSFTPANTTSYYPVFGAAAWDNNAYKYTGSMDDMRAYSKALSEWQIKDIVANYNQQCETAVELPVEGNSCSGTYYAQNYGGNGANGPATNCGGNTGGDSWFSITVPASGDLTISSDAVTGSDADDILIEAYTGSCGNLTYLDCNDAGGGFSELELTGLTPGDVIYAKSWYYSNNAFGQYVVCAFEPVSDVGIDEVDNSISMTLFPNPATDQVTIEADLENTTDVSITLTNSMGQVMKTIEVNNTNSILHSIDVSELPNGIYFVKLKSSEISSTKRLIIKQ